MKIIDYLEDISKLTKEEIEERSIPCPLDENGHVQLTSEYWNEIDGIRYLKKPLIVDFAPWLLYTLDCASLIANLFGPYTLCIIAFSTSKEMTSQLGNAFYFEHLGHKGYGFAHGFGREELNCID